MLIDMLLLRAALVWRSRNQNAGAEARPSDSVHLQRPGSSIPAKKRRSPAPWGLAAGLILSTAVVSTVQTASVGAAAQGRQGAPSAQSSVLIEADAMEASRVPYQAFLAADCFNPTLCRFVSNAVPRGHRLEIRRVACQGAHISELYPPQFIATAEVLTRADAFVSQIDYLAARYTRTETVSVWAISEPVLMFVSAGRKLRVSIDSGLGVLQPRGCTLSGYLVTLGTSS